MKRILLIKANSYILSFHIPIQTLDESIDCPRSQISLCWQINDFNIQKYIQLLHNHHGFTIYDQTVM